MKFVLNKNNYEELLNKAENWNHKDGDVPGFDFVFLIITIAFIIIIQSKKRKQT